MSSYVSRYRRKQRAARRRGRCRADARTCDGRRPAVSAVFIPTLCRPPRYPACTPPPRAAAPPPCCQLHHPPPRARAPHPPPPPLPPARPTRLFPTYTCPTCCCRCCRAAAARAACRLLRGVVVRGRRHVSDHLSFERRCIRAADIHRLLLWCQGCARGHFGGVGVCRVRRRRRRRCCCRSRFLFMGVQMVDSGVRGRAWRPPAPCLPHACTYPLDVH